MLSADKEIWDHSLQVQRELSGSVLAYSPSMKVMDVLVIEARAVAKH
jgi:hypothetical protein